MTEVGIHYCPLSILKNYPRNSQLCQSLLRQNAEVSRSAFLVTFLKSAFQRFLSYTLISHTNAHAARGRPTQNDVERFRNGPVHELSSLTASQMSKVQTSSDEVTNEPYASSNFENTGKTVTADLTTNYDAEMNTSLAEKNKNVRDHDFEGGANNSELDLDTGDL